MSIRDIILLHVRASGPCSFRSIARYVGEQYVGAVSTDDYVIASQITKLIRDEKMALYDDGVSFDACDE